MAGIRAITVILDEPSAAARSLHDIFGWVVDGDFGTFASLALPTGIPLWINAPAPGEATASGVVIHLHVDDVDAAFRGAVERGALVQREPADQDYGDRSAWVTSAATPGVVFDLSRPSG